MNTQKVIRPPPIRSHGLARDGAGQRADQRPEEGILEGVDLRKQDLREQRERRREADERAESAGIEPAHDPVVRAPEDHRLIGEGRLHRGDVVHAEPGREGRGDDERHEDEAGVLQPQRRRDAIDGRGLRIAAKPAENAGRDGERHDELHDADAEIAEAGIDGQRIALLRLGEEERDVGHRGGEVAAAEAAEQRQGKEDPVGRIRVLHGIAHAERRNQQRPGRQRRPQPAAENRRHEAVEDAQRRAGEAGQRSQPEELLVVKAKPTLGSFATTTDQTIQTANESSRQGTEIHRLRRAMARPPPSQKVLSSGRQSSIAALCRQRPCCAGPCIGCISGSSGSVFDGHACLRPLHAPSAGSRHASTPATRKR